MAHIIAEALSQAVSRFARNEEQSLDIVMVTVMNSVNVDGMYPGDEMEVSHFQLNHPRISWRVKVLVADNGVLRVVLHDVLTDDLNRLLVRGTVHVRSCSDKDEDHRDHPVDPQVEVNDEAPGSRQRIVVDTEGPTTIASVHRATVSAIGVTMTTFYYHPLRHHPHPASTAGEDRADGDSSEDAFEVAEITEVDARAVANVDLRDARLLDRLSADFGHLLTTQTEADVTLVVEKLPVRAHRAILAARSDVFRRLLRRHQDKAEPVELVDAPREAFLKVLDFVYTGDVAGLQGLEKDVLVLASRFGIADLADSCCRRLLRALRRDHTTALDMLAFAERHDVHRLKQSALLVAVEHLCEVTASQQWHEYKQSMPSLAADLLETAAQVLSKQ